MKTLLLLVCMPFVVLAQSSSPYKNLVLQGGGVRGLAYAGAISALHKKGLLQQIENVAGSSAGSIAALLICCGYQPAEIDSIMYHLPVEEFNDGKYGIVGKYNRVRTSYGIYKGERFEEWLTQIVAQKTGDGRLSFAALKALAQKEKQYKALYCTGTNISKQQLQIFSDQYTPDMPIALAVRISSGIPLYFEPVPLNNDFEKVKPGKDSGFVNYFVDGGMMANFPISMFDTCMDNGNPLICHPLRFNNATLGIKLERPEQIDSLAHQSINIPPYQINKFTDYINALSNLMMETLNRKYPNLENEKGRTIYISHNNLSPRPRKMETDEKQGLYENGVKAVELFFATPEN